MREIRTKLRIRSAPRSLNRIARPSLVGSPPGWYVRKFLTFFPTMRDISLPVQAVQDRMALR
jgi:hypothetical protein